MEVHTLDAPGKPDTPSSISKDVKDKLSSIRQAKRTLRGFLNNRNDDGSKLSVDQLRELSREKGKSLLDVAILNLGEEYSAEECWSVFSHPEAAGFDEKERITRSGGIVDGCIRRGIFGALKDEADGEGITSGKWYEDDGADRRGRGGDAPDPNDLYYGVALGAIAEHAEAYARGILPPAPRGSSLSSPWARFVRDAEDPPSSASDGAATSVDVRICRASAGRLKSGAFQGRRAQWACDGRFGFARIGRGYRGGEFSGEVFSLRGGRLVSRNVKDEFWAAPRNQWFFADGSTETAWVHADRRVKGFTIDSEDRLATSYVFNVEILLFPRVFASFCCSCTRTGGSRSAS